MATRDINPAAHQNEIVAFFSDQSDALSAISELKEAGFTSDQIGFAVAGGRAEEGSAMGHGTLSSHADAGEHDQGMWEKIKEFFSGEHESYRGQSHDYDDTFSHLSASPDQARYYSEGISAGGALVTVTADQGRLAAAREILTDNDGDLRTSGFDQMAGISDRNMTTGSQTTGSEMTGSAGNQTERRLELRGELLRAVKQRVQTGEIRLRKDVITENKTINVPVTREDVIVERVSADQVGRRPGNVGPIGEGEEIRIPVSEERVTVTKEPVVTGEVRVQKRAVQDTQQVSDTVRREEVRVENEGNVKVTDKNSLTDKTTGKKKPAA
jgi:uncharacterized protein (TIGR02271 family)